MLPNVSNQQQLIVIAACTKRKRTAAAVRLPILRSIARERLPTVASEWCDALDCAQHDREVPLIPASELYVGDSWASTERLISQCKVLGYDCTLWIVSAGYGLIQDSALVVPYEATWPSSARSDCAPARATDWWDALSQWKGPDSDEPRTLRALMAQNPATSFLVLLPRSYLQAVEFDLLDAVDASNPAKLIIAAGSAPLHEALEPYALRYERTVRASVGGTLRAIHPRVLLAALERSTVLDRQALQHAIDALEVEGRRATAGVVRLRLSDAALAQWITDQLDRCPTSSRSALLRQLRSRGAMACEQKRFARIYKATAPRRLVRPERIRE